jgi:hypothetical protein
MKVHYTTVIWDYTDGLRTTMSTVTRTNGETKVMKNKSFELPVQFLIAVLPITGGTDVRYYVCNRKTKKQQYRFYGCSARANKSHEVHAYAQLYKREAPRHLFYPARRKLAAGRIEEVALLASLTGTSCPRGPSPPRHLGVARIIKSITREDMRRRTATPCMAPPFSKSPIERSASIGRSIIPRAPSCPVLRVCVAGPAVPE